MLVRVLRVLLLLAALVIMVDSKMQCGPDEHEHGNICCRNCMSGQYVRKPCSENHGVGECEVCGDETYTSHSSGLTYCLPCTQCRKDQEVVANCTRTSNRQCQCKTGFYCESEDREICRPCHSCPEGTVIRHPCNATTDTVCEEEKGKILIVGLKLGSANLSWKGKYFWSCRTQHLHNYSIQALLYYIKSCQKQYVNQWVWLCPN
nr:tumor necrosis factor receptor superfamily member 26-like isoform X1 [Loxodonta africana]